MLLQAKEIADLQSKLDESSGKIHSLQGQVIKIQVRSVAMVTICIQKCEQNELKEQEIRNERFSIQLQQR